MFRSHIQKMENRGAELIVPDFAKGLEWFNSSPLSFKDNLKGKIVVLDFWTYCCINCMHVLPKLHQLEKKYARDPVVFVGVHSAKFINEQFSENIRKAILRYDIVHPVVNDSSMSMWKALGVTGWPTFVVVGPKGNLLFSTSGEMGVDDLDAYISAILNYYPQKEFNQNPLPLPLEKNKSLKESLLSFPGKIAIDNPGRRLFISDSNHNRIVVVSIEGNFIDEIGSGEAGLKDGEFSKAQFYHPQGLVYHDNCLFVADTENHALRKIDFDYRKVVTLAGNGKQGDDYVGGNKGKEQMLNSPWDVTFDGIRNKLFIAMAGSHQIWTYDLANERIEVFSGTGMEENLNSTRRLYAAWAQPSGLAIEKENLYIADSESSTVRSIKLKDGSTSTLVGGEDQRPYNLFSFGDKDGIGDQAKLQHPLAVLWLANEKCLIVADTYNHKLKKLDPFSRSIKTWIGTGKPGQTDGSSAQAQFAEPSGLALFSEETLFVADTNNHAIRQVSVATGEVSTLELKNVPKHKIGLGRQEAKAQAFHTLTRLPLIKMQSGAQGSFILNIACPPGFHQTPDASNYWQFLTTSSFGMSIQPENLSGVFTLGVPIEIPFHIEFSEAIVKNENHFITMEVVAYFCDDVNTGTCYFEALLFEIPFEEGLERHINIPLNYTLKKGLA